MIAGTIWKNLKTTLENNPALSKYIKKVHELHRYDLPPESFPCIMLQPSSDNAVETDFNTQQRLYLGINIYAYSSYNLSDFHRSVVGDNVLKGIFDINQDIRACLRSSYSLGGTVYEVKLDETSYAEEQTTDNLAVRGMRMPVRILYFQQDSK